MKKVFKRLCALGALLLLALPTRLQAGMDGDGKGDKKALIP
ncbi:MAG: hypothetical protein A49_06090 [Methyloceanibacter sp.]|nr:MAG: hypothetical protein A49_06090 [Methyloceanibacter sp.]